MYDEVRFQELVARVTALERQRRYLLQLRIDDQKALKDYQNSLNKNTLKCKKAKESE